MRFKTKAHSCGHFIGFYKLQALTTPPNLTPSDSELMLRYENVTYITYIICLICHFFAHLTVSKISFTEIQISIQILSEQVRGDSKPL